MDFPRRAKFLSKGLGEMTTLLETIEFLQSVQDYRTPDTS